MDMKKFGLFFVFLLVFTGSFVLADSVEVSTNCHLEGRSVEQCSISWGGLDCSWGNWEDTSECGAFDECRLACGTKTIENFNSSEYYNKTEIDEKLSNMAILLLFIDIIQEIQIIELDNLIDDLTEAVEAMDSGSVNLFYQSERDKLQVWGEAPSDSKKVVVCLKEGGGTIGYPNLTGNWGCDYKSEVSVNSGNNHYRAIFNNISKNWEPNYYNVITVFYDDDGVMEDYTTSAIFTGLYLDKLASDVEDLLEDMSTLEGDLSELEGRVNDNEEDIDELFTGMGVLNDKIDSVNGSLTNLWEKVNSLGIDDIEGLRDALDDLQTQIDNLGERVSDLEKLIAEMNHATINLRHVLNNDENKLRVWGEAPEGADTVKIRMGKIGGTSPTVAEVKVTTGGDNGNWYNTWVDLEDFEEGKYNVYANFYYDDETWMSGYNVGALFYGLSGFGFLDLDVDSQISTYLSNKVEGKIRYEVMLDEMLPYGVVVVRDDEGKIYQVLRNQSFFAGEKYVFTDDILFSELGDYNLTLSIEGTDWESCVVETNVVDIAPTTEIKITSPLPNVGDIYWFNSDVYQEILLEAQVAPSVDIDYVSYYYYVNDEGIGVRMKKQSETSPYVANSTLSTSQFSEAIIYSLDVDSIGAYGSDKVLVAVDNTAPVIFSVSPDTGAYAGVMMVYVNATDALSGIESVYVYLVSKDDSSISYSLEANYNSSSGLYEVGFNTTQMSIPNGEYDISAIVTDVVGNSATMTVDPIIDNTAPVISSEYISDVFTDDYTVKVGANVVDFPAGLDEVYALLSGDNLTEVRVNLSCDDSTCLGSYVDENLTSGNYTLKIFATDKAGNVAYSEHTEEVVVKDRPVVVTPSSSGGSSGGSRGWGAPEACTETSWTCDEWSVCENSYQTRICEKVEVCNGGFSPLIAQGCEMPEVLGDEVVLGNETVSETEPRTGFITGAVIGGNAGVAAAGVGILAILGGLGFFVKKKFF